MAGTSGAAEKCGDHGLAKKDKGARSEMTKLFVFDLDGTLADLTHRLYLIQNPLRNENSDEIVEKGPEFIKKYQNWKPDWPSFYRSSVNDSPKQWVIDLLNLVRKQGEVLILSGRSDEVKGYTTDWLHDKGVLYDYLVMREAGSHEPDDKLKATMLDDFLKDKDFKVQFIVDDRQRVINMWLEKGYQVLQIANALGGNY